ncbi:MAG: PhoH family protein [Planctomycetes bacterium]|nr:PhoH family protein [Planctomycetota bacterium]
MIEIHGFDEIRALLGPLDSNTRLIRELHQVNVLVRDGRMRLMGAEPDVQRVRAILQEELEGIRQGHGSTPAQIARRLRRDSPIPVPGAGEGDDGQLDPRVAGIAPGPLKPRTAGQARYWRALHEHEVVFGVGPAGTGKTYLAVAAAVAAVKSGRTRRIVLVRPAVEAGEKLGFLPGDFHAKVNPYLRPLYDALHDLLDPTSRQRYLEDEIVEVCPLAYMRGRTLNDAFVILDEAQNCTVSQMLMFLTRMGERSHVVVTGDPSQVDLPATMRSGLADAVTRLKGVPGIEIVKLGRADVVRHRIVQDIIRAYGEES